MSRQRFIDISFDSDGFPDRTFLGQVIRNSDGINVLRVTVPSVRLKADMTVAFERTDGETGSGLMRRTYEDPVTVFTYVLNSWTTACQGELKLSFSLVYHDPLAAHEIVNDDMVTQVFPVDYMRMVVITVEEAIGSADPLCDEPNVTADVLGQLSEIKDDIDRFDEEQDIQDVRIETLEQNPISLDMGLWS